MNKVQLLNDICSSYNKSELKNLCYSLQVPYEDVDGDNRREKAHELIEYMDRRQCLAALVKEIIKERPFLEEKYKDINQQSQKALHLTEDYSMYGEEGSLNQNDAEDIRNPYSAGSMVTKKEMFFGREDELRRIKANLFNMGSSSIVGLRRIGKSSLLYYLSHQDYFPSNHKVVFAFLDLQEAVYHTLSGVLNGAFQKWMLSVETPLEYSRPNTLVEFSTLARQLRNDGYHPILCLDEFENLTKRTNEFNDDVFETWRALANQHQIAFVTCSRVSLSDLIKSSGLTSSFYNIFLQVDLGLLDDQSAQKLLTQPLSSQGLLVSGEIVTLLIKLCGRHPFYLQLAAFHLYDALTSDRPHDLDKVKDDIVWAADRNWNGLWQSLTDKEQSILKFPNANHLGNQNKLKQALIRKGLILDETDGYMLFCTGFKDWLDNLLRNAKIQEHIEVVEDLSNQTTKPIKEMGSSKELPVPSKNDSLNLKHLLITTFITLAVFVTVAVVLENYLQINSVGSLVFVLAILFPFILVLVGKVTGQDFLDLLLKILNRN